MRRIVSLGLALAAVAVLAAAGLWWWHRSHPPELPPPPAPARAEPAAPAGPRHPLPAAAGEAPLPPLAASDPAIREALARALPPSAFERLVLEGFVRRVVATIDNLPREEYAARLNPVRPVPGLPLTTTQGDALTLSPQNAQRYAPYLAAFEAIDADALVAFYTRHYPLFQEAYVELGYPQGYFNDRLVAAIDDLLAAPEPTAPPKLVQPKVLYRFADPELEALSAGQKVMLRIGPQNAARAKARLREIRARITRTPP